MIVSVLVSSKKKRMPIWVFLVSFFFLLHTAKSVDVDARDALVDFFVNLSNNFSQSGPVVGWDRTSDPCQSNWTGISCNDQPLSVKSIVLDNFNLSGTFKPGNICGFPSLASSVVVISLSNNNLQGQNLEGIARCNKLTHVYLSGNLFSGSLPDSLSQLNNLKKFEIANNRFHGGLPDLAQISGLVGFLVQNNQFSGPIPNFHFSNLVSFNVSSNNFTGPIPPGGDLFNVSSYLGNPELCGDPLPECLPPAPATSSKQAPDTTATPKKSRLKPGEVLMYSGYVVLGLALIVMIIMLKVCKKGKKTEESIEEGSDNHKAKPKDVDGDSVTKSCFVSNEFRSTPMSESQIIPGNSVECTPISSSLIVLTSPVVNGLKYEELLKAPAELLGRGKHGSVYKVNCEEQGMTLAVKRIKDWSLPCNDFKLRMRRLNQVKHPNVSPVVAFYCSRQEKLLVYEYQPNGNLLKLLHGMPTGHTFEWSSRLGVASAIVEALAFMHEELRSDGIAHGNLKSSNILFNQNMEPCISEYGLMAIDNLDFSLVQGSPHNSSQLDADKKEAAFKADVHALGVILLELLTGKMPMVQNNGMDLATWVVSVVREEWTVEVFDRALIREGASEERMVNLLQVAIKCVDQDPGARPSINQVAIMINNIKEEDERSMDGSESRSPFPLDSISFSDIRNDASQS